MRTILRDVGFALRSFRRTPAFTVAAMATIALGVGMNTAIFSVVNGVVLRPLPYPEPDRVVRPWAEKIFSQEMFVQFQEQTGSFSHLARFRGVGLTLTVGDEPELIGAGSVTPEYFDVLGTPPLLGRTFDPADGVSGAEPVMVLGYGLWQRRFGGDPEIVGRAIGADGEGAQSRTVVGVMPRDHATLTGNWEAWIPEIIVPDSFVQSYNGRLMGRLAPGITVERARADVGRLVTSFSENHPTQFRPVRRSPVPVLTLHETVVGDVRTTLWLLLGAVGFVLLIACTNVANLLLARSAGRHDEMAVRRALGASRGRLMQQLLTENALLGLAGGAVGSVLALVTVGATAERLAAAVPRAGEIRTDWAVLGFAAGVSLLAGLIFGSVPALRNARGRMVGAARGVAGGRHRNQLNGALVVAEITLAMVLVVGAGLMLKSLVQLSRVDVGFTAERLVTMRPIPPTTRYASGEQVAQYFGDVLERVRTVPVVTGATTINYLPMTSSNSGVPYLVEGQVPDPTVSQVISFRAVTPEYFETMQIPIVRGRPITDADRDDAQSVGVVNEAMVEAHWGGADPIGQPIRFASGDPWLTVIGVARNIRQHELDEVSRPLVYTPVAQSGAGGARLVVRVNGDATAAVALVRDAVRAVDPTVPIVQVRSMDELVDESMGHARFYANIFGTFGLLALALGGLGVYGVMSYITSQRMREFGIRVALGATPTQVVTATVRGGLVPVVLGIGIGTVAAGGLTRLLDGLLFEVRATDPMVFGGVVVVLGVLGVAANYFPAVRASRVDPMVVLKQ